jgi:nucleoside-diphosphate-sugar epimerase
VAVVIGGTGFVGSYIVQQLLCDGISVRATCRNIGNSQWVKKLGGTGGEKNISLHEFEYGKDGKPKDDSSRKVLEDILLPGADAVFFCVGFEKQDPETITYMVNACLTVLQAVKEEMKKSGRKMSVVVTSSTGSTNPPDALPGSTKNELDFWSDPEIQKQKRKFSPAAKTLMELAAFEFVGRNKRNEIIDEKIAIISPR